MKNKLFSTAALLCAVSFNVLQASHGNPYEMSQESTRQNRCIRVITEIPVEMAGFMMPRQSCGCSNANESKTVGSLLDSAGKSATDDEAILQLIRLLTKNLLADPSTSLDNATYLPDPTYHGTANEGTFGIGGAALEELNAAREKAASRVSEAKAAMDAEKKAKAALEEAKRTRATEEEIKARDEAAKAAAEHRLEVEVIASKAVESANSAAAEAVMAGEQPFEYQEKQLSAGEAKFAKVVADQFAKLRPADKLKSLKAKASQFMKTSAANSLLSTNIAKAEGILKALRDTGATMEEIRSNLGELTIPKEIEDIAFAALPPSLLPDA